MNGFGLLKHLSIYSTGSLLVAIAGFISFPILTRIFTVADYGLLNLVSVTMLLLLGVAKLGQQHSTVRFHSISAATGDPGELATFRSTALGGMLATSVAVALIWFVVVFLLPAHWWNDSRVRGIFLLTAVLIVTRTMDSAISNLMRAEQRSAALTIYSVCKRYGVLAAVVATLLLISPTIHGFFTATIVAETAAVSILAIVILRGTGIGPARFSTPLLRSMLAFGIPMVGYEVSANILALGDRYALQFLLGPEAVGVYSAAYNLCEYVQTIVIASVSQAAVPMYLKIWEEQGREPTERMLGSALYFYVLLSLPMVFGMWAVAPELIGLLATDKYIDGASSVPWVMAGMSIDGCMIMVAAGLYVQKQTRKIAGLVIGAAVLNVLLNVALIPLLGIKGSAIATFFTHLGLAGAAYGVARKYVTVALPWGAATRSLFASAVMYAVVSAIELPVPSATLVVRVIAGALTYGLLILAIDVQARKVTLSTLSRVSRAFA